jgi:riboflavin kinase/FMN adenylyltransferase
VKVYSSLKNFCAKNPVLTLGVFDGVHIGHRKIIEELKKIAKRIGGESVILTFWPHPRIVISNNKETVRFISTLDEKIKLLDYAGIDHLIIFPFTKEFSQISASDFVEKFLINRIGVKHFVIGFNHHFGRRGEGDYEYLKKCAFDYSFGIEKINAFSMNGTTISSTAIRQLIEDGDIERANYFLGYEFYISGVVVGGKKIGRTIAFPTANIFVEEDYKLIPCNGVYAVEVEIWNKNYIGMLNIGIRPTIRDSRRNKSVEVHIINFDQEIYKERIKIKFKVRIRNEQKFPDIETLKKQLQADKKQVVKLFEANNTFKWKTKGEQ